MRSLVTDIVDLMEGSIRPNSLEYWQNRFGDDATAKLIELKALKRSAPAVATICSACFECHDAELESDGAGGFRYYCPQAGWTIADTGQVERFSPNIDFILDVLIGADGRRRERLPQMLWVLDDEFHCGQRFTLAFARELKDIDSLNTVLVALENVMPAATGLLVTSSKIELDRIRLPHRWQPVALDQAIDESDGHVVRNIDRLASWAHAASSRPDEKRAGRRNLGDEIKQVLDRLVEIGDVPDGASNSAIAKIIIAEWSNILADGSTPPARSTVMGKLAKGNFLKS